MKNSIIHLLILSVFTIHCFGQDTIVKHWKNGKIESQGIMKNDKEEGKWTYWYDNGQKWSEGMYADGRKTGEWKYWYETGIVKENANQENGAYISYYQDGAKETEGNMKNEQRMGHGLLIMTREIKNLK